MLQAVLRRASEVKTGASQGNERIRIVSVCGPSNDIPNYRLLENEVLDAVKVTETSESGTVPALTIENTLDVHVFLMDGQELRGSKQNRILNTDVFVPPNSKLNVPVSCVEAGRWGYDSPTFVPGKAASYRTRSGKSARVHAALKKEGRHDADQAAVWDEVANELVEADAASPTSALSDVYAKQDKQLADFRKTLKLPDEAVGLAVFLGFSFLGLDLFDRHTTLVHFWESLIDSYALAWLSRRIDVQRPMADTPENQQVKIILGRAATEDWEAFESPGDGKDHRLNDEWFTGSALVYDDQAVIHLQVFPNEGHERGETNRQSQRRLRLHRRYGRTNRRQEE